MVKCKICGGNCDNGELIGGICPECLEVEAEKQARAEEMVRIMDSACYQMELGLEV